MTDEIVKRQHFGTAYRAASAKYLGRSDARWLHVLPNSQPVTARTLAKIRGEERGMRYASALLVAGGIPERRPFESGRDWLDRVAGDFQRVRHPGNLAFSWTLRSTDGRSTSLTAAI